MAEVLHRKKFLNGEMTAREAHIRYGFGGRRCDGCHTQTGEMRIKVFMPLDELTRRAPNFVALATVSSPMGEGKLPTVRFKESAADDTGKDYLKVTDTVWCRDCRLEAQLTAAKDAPSWAVIEIDEGKKDIIQVGA